MLDRLQFLTDIDRYEYVITWTAIYLGLIFFGVLSVITVYLRPETKLEKAMTYKAVALFLVFVRVTQVKNAPTLEGANWYGAFAWTNLAISFFVSLWAVLTTTFGQKGRRKAKRNALP